MASTLEEKILSKPPDVPIAERWSGMRGAPKTRLTSFVQRTVLSAVSGELLLVLDHADLIHPRPFHADVVGLLRSWAEKSRVSAPWTRLRLLVSVSIHPARLRSAKYESPFANLSEPIQVGDFTPSQIADLARARGLRWTENDTVRLMAHVGGHSYLVCAALGDLCDGRYSLDALTTDLPLGRSHVGDYLQRLRDRLDAAPALSEAFAALAEDSSAQIALASPPSDDTNAVAPLDPLDDLIRMGLVKQGKDGTHPVRYELYRRLLRKTESSSFVPVSPVPRPVSTSWLLHLSDLHINTLEQANIWANQLLEDLVGEQRVASVHSIIISGDIGNRSTEDEYRAAEHFISQLQTELDIPDGHILLVPGNHDLSWPLSEAAYSLHLRKSYTAPLSEGTYIVQGEAVQVRQDDLYRERFRHYAVFHKHITGQPYPLDYEQQTTIVHLAGRDILLVGLNSAWNIDHHFKARASIHPGAIANLLTGLRKRPEFGEGTVKIAVWHHPLYAGVPDRITDHGFVEQLCKSDFRLALHGHMHQAENQLFRYDQAPGGRRLHVVAAGTFGAPVHAWQPGYPLQYNLLQLEGRTLTVHTRRREQITGAWKPDARWTPGKGQNPLPYYTIQLGDE